MGLLSQSTYSVSNEKPNISVRSAPEVDVIFAVSATSSDAARTLRTIKDTLTYVINTYGVGNIRYVSVLITEFRFVFKTQIPCKNCVPFDSRALISHISFLLLSEKGKLIGFIEWTLSCRGGGKRKEFCAFR